MNDPLVSIIINCHNGEKYLEQALQSIFNQKYKNWEIIFVDNCSNDNSFNIIKKFDNAKINYFYINNKTSLYKARNYALNKCNGAYISFLDVDDYWLPNKISTQIDLINKKKFDVVYSNYYVKNYNFPFLKKIFSKSYLPSGNITNALLKNYTVGILTLMINKKKIIEIDKLKFNENYDNISDFDFVLRCSTQNLIGAIQYPLAVYGRHFNNLSKQIVINQYHDLNNWIQDYKSVNELKKFKNFKFIIKKIDYLKIQNQISKNLNFIQKIKIILHHNNFREKIKLFLILVLPENVIRFLRK